MKKKMPCVENCLYKVQKKANPCKIGQSSQNTIYIYVKVERDFYSEQQQQTSFQSCFVLKVGKYLLTAPFNNASIIKFNLNLSLDKNFRVSMLLKNAVKNFCHRILWVSVVRTGHRADRGR